MLRSSEMAERLGIGKNKMIELANQGAVPAIKLPSGHYRFDPNQVEAALSNKPLEGRDDA
jgi:excisionase family DNA binding protein